MSKLIYISPTEQYPNGYLVKTDKIKPDRNSFGLMDYHGGLQEYNAHLLTLPVYASCSVECKGKWKGGEDVTGKFEIANSADSTCRFFNKKTPNRCAKVRCTCNPVAMPIASGELPLTPPAEQPEVKGEDLVKLIEFETHGLEDNEQSKFYNKGLRRAIGVVREWQASHPSGDEQPVEAEAYANDQRVYIQSYPLAETYQKAVWNQIKDAYIAGFSAASGLRWVKASERLPEVSGVYVVKTYANKRIVRYFNLIQFGYKKIDVSEWLDEDAGGKTEGQEEIRKICWIIDWKL